MIHTNHIRLQTPYLTLNTKCCVVDHLGRNSTLGAPTFVKTSSIELQNIAYFLLVPFLEFWLTFNYALPTSPIHRHLNLYIFVVWLVEFPPRWPSSTPFLPPRQSCKSFVHSQPWSIRVYSCNIEEHKGVGWRCNGLNQRSRATTLKAFDEKLLGKDRPKLSSNMAQRQCPIDLRATLMLTHNSMYPNDLINFLKFHWL